MGLVSQNLVLRIAVRGDQLRGVLGPGQIAHLRARVHALHGLARQRVPESNAPIRRSSAAGQQSVVMRRPGNRLHRRHMLRVGLHGIHGMLIPHVQPIVIAAAGQVLIVRRPFEATHLLPMAGQSPFRLQLWRPRIPLDDPTIPRPTRQDVTVPGQGAHAGRMAIKLVDLLVGRHIPDGHIAVMSAHGDGVATLVP